MSAFSSLSFTVEYINFMKEINIILLSCAIIKKKKTGYILDEKNYSEC